MSTSAIKPHSSHETGAATTTSADEEVEDSVTPDADSFAQGRVMCLLRILFLLNALSTTTWGRFGS